MATITKSKITISEKEYKELIEGKLRYEYLKQVIEGDFFTPPPNKDIKSIIRAFKNTKKYNNKFIAGLEKGLGRSSHFNK